MIRSFPKILPKQERPVFFFLLAAGILNHFLYDWTRSSFIALFCPINESIWEHLKLLFFPFLFCSLFQCVYKKLDPSPYFYYRLLSILCGMLSIVTLFYTYTGVLGRNIFAFDILIFVIAIFVTLRSVPLFKKRISRIPSLSVTGALWLILTACFFLFTCFPPDLPLFISF